MDEINYSVSFNRPHTHYCEVEISLNTAERNSIVFSMPVWTPGSYLVREFAKNVEEVYAENFSGEKLPVEKINKNSWKANTSDQKNIRFKYKVYCNELTVRTSEVNTEHAFLSSAGVFMFVREFENRKCILNINLPPDWKNISTGLTKESDNVYSAENYDVFIDSPVEAGNQNILEFDIKGIKHYICLSGKGNYDEDILIKDFKTIAEEEIKLLGGEIPYKDYTYIVHLVEKGGGGLEHLNSFVVQFPRWGFTNEKLYKKFLGLVSHEFFHLWNVKRIRPEALGPFDYDNENYTKGLWVAEGWTSFYDNLILRRCGILTDEEYYEFLAVELNDIMRFEGRFHQSVEESSYDTWIRFYRKDDNYNNTQISYYTKGALVAMMLNLEIIKSTDCGKSLDDALRMLLEDYKKDSSKGYSDMRVKEVAETVCGKNLDDFWNKYIRGTEDLPVNEYLDYAGLKLVNEIETDSIIPDFEVKLIEGKLMITKIHAGTFAYESGLNFNDELIAIDDVRMNEELLNNFFKGKKKGDKVKFLISRKGLTEEIISELLHPLPKYKIEALENKTSAQEKVLLKWLADEIN